MRSRGLIHPSNFAHQSTRQRKGDKGASGAGSGSGAGSRPRTARPRNETASSEGFFFEENEALAAKHAASGVEETEEERRQRLQEEEEWMLNLSREDTDAHTEVFSEPGERERKAKETKDRYDFTCLTVEEVARSYQVRAAICRWGCRRTGVGSNLYIYSSVFF